MAVGTGAGFRVDYSQVRQLFEVVKDAKQALNAMDPNRGVKGYSPTGNRMERALRAESRKMADQVIVPALADAASTPFEQVIAQTARAVNDRLPVVKVGKVQPKGLRGWRYVKQPWRKQLSGTLAYGSEYGPKGGHRDSARKHKGMGVNYYGRARNERGYWITPTLYSARVTRGVIQGYSAVVDAIFAQFNVNKSMGDL